MTMIKIWAAAESLDDRLMHTMAGMVCGDWLLIIRVLKSVKLDWQVSQIFNEFKRENFRNSLWRCLRRSTVKKMNKEFIELSNENDVKYMVVGAYAVALQGLWLTYWRNKAWFDIFWSGSDAEFQRWSNLLDFYCHYYRHRRIYNVIFPVLLTY